MRKILFITLISLIAFTSCEKYSLDNAEQGGTSTDGGNVIVHISDMGATPYSRITYSFFHAGSKIKNINQTADDSHFGHVSLSLDEGIYQFVAIAHCGNGNATVSSPEKVTFYKNKVTDTAHYYGYLEVTGDETETSISLKRSVAKVRLHIKDDIPSTAKRIKCYYTGGSSTLDATSGYGCVNSKQTEERDMEPTCKDYDFYTIPHQDGRKLQLTITVYDELGNTLASKELKDIETRQNEVTTCSISLFDGDDTSGTNGQFEFDPSWDGEIIVDFE